LFTAEPRMTAWIVSPSSRASSRRRRTTTPTPLPKTVPRASWSNDLQCPSGRKDLPLLIDVAPAVRLVDGHPAGQGHVAFPADEALACVVDRHQGGRAGRLDAHARTLQVELVRDPGREEVLVVAGVAKQEEPDRVPQLIVGQHVLPEVRADPATGEDAHAPPNRSGT
jgi:hypothetical protein